MDLNNIEKMANYFSKCCQKIAIGKKKKSGVATKSNPALWSRCKADAKRKMGGKWSARAAQHAVYLYKKRGGKYKGKKPTAKTNKLKKWTKQKWMYLSDFKKRKKKSLDQNILLNNLIKMADLKIEAKSKKNPGRYLPLEKWKSLTPSQRKATDQKKKREGKKKQYVSNTEAAKVKSKSKYY